MRQFTLLVCLLAAALALAGCGDSSTSSGASDEGQGEPLSKAEFIERADHICQNAKKESASLESRLGQLNKTAKAQKEFNEVADVIRKLTSKNASELAQLKQLEPPTADAKVIDNLFATVEDRISAGGTFSKAVEKNNQSSANSSAKKANAASAKTKAITKRYGFKVCGT